MWANPTFHPITAAGNRADFRVVCFDDDANNRNSSRTCSRFARSCWREPASTDCLELHPMEARQSSRASFAEPDRTGASTRQKAQSPRFAIHPHTVFQRTVFGRALKDRKQRPAHARRRWATAQHAGKEGASRTKPQHGRLSTATFEARLHSQSERETASARHSDEAGSRRTGAAQTRSRTPCRNDCRSEFLWLSERAFGRRRH